MPKFTKENASAMGRRGGQATHQKHGSAHMSQIGARGFWQTVVRHWHGDARAYVNYTIALGIAATDPVPENRAFEHNHYILRSRAQAGLLAYVRPYWQPKSQPDQDQCPF